MEDAGIQKLAFPSHLSQKMGILHQTLFFPPQTSWTIRCIP